MPSNTMNTQSKSRWLAFIVLCLGTLMEVIDSTIVNVALPSIKSDLQFSESTLAWVVNAYLLTFGGFLLLGGRLGDIFGYKKLFLIGIAVFTFSSLLCGVAQTQEVLIIARAIQGFGGAITSAVALSLIMNLFQKPDDRAKAMGYFGFIAAGGGSVGVLLGGFVTNSFDWHWNFLINIPIGLLVLAASVKLLPNTKADLVHKHLDVWGAVTVTASLLLAVYAIVNGNQAGWASMQTWGLLFGAGILMVVFIYIESKVKAPLVNLGLFKNKTLTLSNIIGVLWAGAMFAWFFLSSLYLQIILQYNPLQVGLAFLPANIIMAIFSIGLSAKLVMKFGIQKTLGAGLALAGLGLLLYVRAPVNGNFLTDVLPSMILLGVGAGMAFNPMLLAAMSGVKPEESGLASGLVNTSFMMGGALGLAVLASLAGYQTMNLLASGIGQIEALNSGYHAAFLVGGIFAALAAFLGYKFLNVTVSSDQMPVH
jgi:EmrB/QacA subfamily drug resistance transporter